MWGDRYIENVCSHLHDSVYISVISSAFSSLCYRHGEWVQIKQTMFKKSTGLFCCFRHRLAGTRTPKCFCPFWLNIENERRTLSMNRFVECCILYLPSSALMAVILLIKFFLCRKSYYDTTYPCSRIHQCWLWIHWNLSILYSEDDVRTQKCFKSSKT